MSDKLYPLINQIFDTQIVSDSHGNVYNLLANISMDEGLFLFNLIRENKSITRTMEIGCAFGISSLFICNALESREIREHIIIDPFQETHYKNIGITNLKRVGVSFARLIDDFSEFALPELLQNDPESFDLIFIDGFHSFDQVLVDFYYANKLIKPGGFIIFDDCSYPSISKAISYILKYPAYELYSKLVDKNIFKRIIRSSINIFPDEFYNFCFPVRVKSFINRVRYSSMIAIRKIENDKRDWKWFRDF